MKIVKIIYTTRPDFANQNSQNIEQVMSDLQLLNNPNIRYTACVGPDNKTFIHTAFFRSEEDQNVLFALPSFKSFQEQLKASIPEVPPQNELLTLIGSSNDIF
jgi:hypothetical protein